jgi:hypothetical protein
MTGKEPQTPAEGEHAYPRRGCGQPRPVRSGAGRVSPGGSDLFVADSEAGLRRMEGCLLSPARRQLVVGIAPGLHADTAADVREILGLEGQLYLISEESLLDQQRLPVPLALGQLSVRIWWPWLTEESDPRDHPLVRPFPGQSFETVFGDQLDLSRPVVRREISRLEGLARFNEHLLEKAIRELERRPIVSAGTHGRHAPAQPASRQGS